MQEWSLLRKERLLWLRSNVLWRWVCFQLRRYRGVRENVSTEHLLQRIRLRGYLVERQTSIIIHTGAATDLS